MKKIFLTFTLLVLTFFTLNAQRHGYNRDKVKAYKTAYFTEKLELTPEEAEKFWPVYNTYSETVHKLKYHNMRAFQTEIREKGGINELTDAEASEYLKKFIKNEKQLTESKIKLYKDLEKIISPKKIMLLNQAEREFTRKLLEEYRRKQRQRDHK